MRKRRSVRNKIRKKINLYAMNLLLGHFFCLYFHRMYVISHLYFFFFSYFFFTLFLRVQWREKGKLLAIFSSFHQFFKNYLFLFSFIIIWLCIHSFIFHLFHYLSICSLVIYFFYRLSLNFYIFFLSFILLFILLSRFLFFSFSLLFLILLFRLFCCVYAFPFLKTLLLKIFLFFWLPVYWGIGSPFYLLLIFGFRLPVHSLVLSVLSVFFPSIMSLLYLKISFLLIFVNLVDYWFLNLFLDFRVFFPSIHRYSLKNILWYLSCIFPSVIFLFCSIFLLFYFFFSSLFSLIN